MQVQSWAKTFIDALDRFVPREIAVRTNDDPLRARTAVGIALLASGVFFTLAIIRAASLRWGIAAVNVAQGAAMIAFPLILRRTAWLAPLVHAELFVAFASFVGLSVLALGAGLTMPAVGLAIVPLLSVPLTGAREAFAWLLASGAALTAIGIAGALEIIPHQRSGETLVAEHAALLVVTTVLYLVGGLYEYRKARAAEHIAQLEEQRYRAERDRIEALANARIAEAERLASLGEIAAMAAHEINNPLSYVGNNLEFVLDEVGSSEGEVADALKEARDGVDRIRKIVDDLQRHGRPDPDESDTADVADAVTTALKTVEGHTRPRARVVTQIDDVPRVVASKGRLVQVLVNLVVNAAQAIPEGHADRNEIRVSATMNGDRVLLEIQDTGPGIPAEIIERVKETFFTTKTGRGSGLGLALCDRILKRYGGELHLANADRGAVASVWLHIAPNARASERPQGAPIPAAGDRRMRVLVVDDDPLVARAIRRQLRGHDVSIVGSGREGLARIGRGEQFDAFLCDMMMPDLTGMDFHDEIAQQHPELRERIVFMSGGTFTERARKFRAAVDNRFLSKPIDATEVHSALVEVVEQGSPRE